MKKLIGALIVLLSVFFIGILILRIWGIVIISIDDMVNSGYTLLLLGVLIIVLIISYGFFFKNNSQVYDKTTGTKAHPKN